MSTAILPAAVEPKRKRGHERVAAITKAATELFAERGYAAVTMTEIAARSSTAIGSLYRFFPTKDVLAATMFERYGKLLTEEMARIAERADRASPRETALALVRMMRGLQKERAGALAMLDAQSDAAALRGGIRQRMLSGLTAVLDRIEGGEASAAETHPRAWMLLYALKAVRQLDLDKPEIGGRLEEDACCLIEGYLACAQPARKAP